MKIQFRSEFSPTESSHSYVKNSCTWAQPVTNVESKTTNSDSDLQVESQICEISETWDIPKTLKIIYQTIIVKRDEKIYHPTIPDIRLVSHSKGSSLSHGSFEDLSSKLRQDRLQEVRKETLPKKGQESLEMTHNYFCETLGHSPDPVLLTVWEQYRKSSTVNQYGNPWIKWVEYRKTAGYQPIPVNPFLFTVWLAATSSSDTTGSPTETRDVAIVFFSKAVLSTSPT